MTHKKQSTVGLLCYAALVTATVATTAGHAGGIPVYRSALPPVLPQAEKPVAEREFDQDGFSRWYIASGRPKVIVLWGRWLGSTVSSWQVDAKEVVTAEVAGRRSSLEGSKLSNESSNAHVQAQRYVESNTDDRQLLKFGEGSPVRQALIERLLAAGVRLVDPATSLRLAARKGGDGESSTVAGDPRRLEIAAFAKYTDLLIEVIPVTRDSYEFEVVAVRDGSLIASGTAGPLEASPPLPQLEVPSDNVSSVVAEEAETATEPHVDGGHLAETILGSLISRELKITN